MKLSITVLNALFAAALAAPAPGSGLAPRSNTRARLDSRRAAKSHKQGHHHHASSSASLSRSSAAASPTLVFPSGFLPSSSSSSVVPSSLSSSSLAAAALSVPSATATRASASSSSATAVVHASSDVEYNESWAGAVVTGSDMTGVSASFAVPDPAIPSSGQTSATEHTASVWIGMDGYNCDGGLWQAGVDATIDSQGTSFYAWYEWYPEDTVAIDLGDIAAGDIITVNLTSSGDYTSGSIVMENKSTGNSFTKTVTDSSAALCGAAIEWIMEDLVVDGSENGLADFGTVTFSDAAGTSKGGSVSPADSQLLDIQDSDGTALTASSTTSDSVVIVYQ
ncbi:hypothetical protein PFICI_04538 [Pestalotiopsis fici W106-1]|uniref:Aspergillopepsin-2 n=1 Tax=Pestalotiopsis fici (strain W106-1 / CGMCC3.15140) TaxID=1229662 RepID=W3XB32_PESFW|nr:uncharacterized protein PFICI_04538 [Pestalotiopsis fici W106-1]ETS82662.1 hypothetical protein PFICI_04538 [Pestalotiopsis fici W106-1]